MKNYNVLLVWKKEKEIRFVKIKISALLMYTLDQVECLLWASESDDQR